MTTLKYVFILLTLTFIIACNTSKQENSFEVFQTTYKGDTIYYYGKNLDAVLIAHNDNFLKENRESCDTLKTTEITLKRLLLNKDNDLLISKLQQRVFDKEDFKNLKNEMITFLCDFQINIEDINDSLNLLSKEEKKLNSSEQKLINELSLRFTEISGSNIIKVYSDSSYQDNLAAFNKGTSLTVKRNGRIIKRN